MDFETLNDLYQSTPEHIQLEGPEDEDGLLRLMDLARLPNPTEEEWRETKLLAEKLSLIPPEEEQSEPTP